MNTNDFSKSRVGDKLWSIYSNYGHDLETNCKIVSISDSKIGVVLHSEGPDVVLHNINQANRFQTLFFSRPQFIAPPEPPRLPDYKEGQWIAVWESYPIPCIRKFVRFIDNGVICYNPRSEDEAAWKDHCALEELPEVLAKWGERK